MRPLSLKTADFQKALGTRPVSRTAHFALHVLAQPETSGAPDGAALSTAGDKPAENLGCLAWRLGLVLPKKQAKRSVTRSLIRHQAREALRRHAPGVWAQGRHGAGVSGWVLRLKAPFDKAQFASAASAALGMAVRAELDELWAHLAAPRHPLDTARAGA